MQEIAVLVCSFFRTQLHTLLVSFLLRWAGVSISCKNEGSCTAANQGMRATVNVLSYQTSHVSVASVTGVFPSAIMFCYPAKNSIGGTLQLCGCFNRTSLPLPFLNLLPLPLRLFLVDGRLR